MEDQDLLRAYFCISTCTEQYEKSTIHGCTKEAWNYCQFVANYLRKAEPEYIERAIELGRSRLYNPKEAWK